MNSVFLCMRSEQRSIVFYDGDCGFCNRSVAWVLKRNTSKELFFASIQSDFTRDFFLKNKFEQPDLSTFYFYSSGELYIKSTAGLQVTRFFSGFWKMLYVGIIIPRSIRDFFYDSIAKRRQRLSKGFCVVLSENERKRFLS